VSGQDLHRTVTAVLSVALVLIGIALLVRTLTLGGGPVSSGVLLGVLFCAAGVGRLVLQRGRG
jgi:hypothetical protein